MLILVILTAGLAQATCAAAAGAGAATAVNWTAAGATGKICSLSMQGFGDRPGLRAVHISCTGGTVTAHAHPVLKRLWGSNLPTQGVVWTENTRCRPSSGCLLTICGQSEAVFGKVNITDIRTAPDPNSEHTALCVSQGSTVVLWNCTFASSSLSSLSVYGNTTRVLLDRCNVSNNNMTLKGVASGIYLQDATIVVWSSSFTHNMALGVVSSTMTAVGNGHVAIVDSTFTGNNAYCGGALRASNTTQVAIKGSRFEANNATWGGALCAEGQARVQILSGTPRTTFINNTATKGAGDILATDQTTMHISKALLVGGQAGIGGGSVQLEGNSTMNIITSTIQGAVALLDGGCVRVTDNSTLRVITSELSGCRAGRHGGGIYLLDNGWLYLTNITISSNSAGWGRNYRTASGGGIGAKNASHLELQDVVLHNNTAFFDGGGLRVNDNATLVIHGPKTRVVNNTAGRLGGGVHLLSANFTPSQLTDLLVVQNNSAYYGANTIVGATSILVVDAGDADHVIASDSREATLVITFNVSGPHGYPSEDLLWVLLSTPSNEVRGTFTANTTTDGKLRKLPVRLKQPPGPYQLAFGNDDWTCEALVNITVIPCPRGWVNGGRDDTCNPCPQGMYSFTTTDATCDVCPTNAHCPGLGVVWPVGGFWKSAPQSVQIHRCYNVNACLGAKALNGATGNQTATRRLLSATPDYKTAQCSGPYKGNLCGQCKQGFGAVRAFLCRKCLPKAAIIVLYVVAVFAMIGLVKLLVFFQTAADIATRPDLQQPIPTELLRALVIHAQWLYIISMMVGVPWPATLAWPLQVIGGVWSSTSGASIGFDCILRASQGMPVAVQKLLICLLTPVGILCGVLVIEAILHYLRHRPGTVGHDFASVVMCIVFMFLPTWVNTALSLFTCVTLDTPAEPPYQAEAVGTWWVQDMSEMCYSRSGYHRGWALGLGIPLTLLLCVALPTGVFAFMWTSRKHSKLHDMQFQKHYGFMYRLWKDEWCWYESVVLLQTCALVMISTFAFALGPFYQGILLATVLAAVGMLLLAVKPYKCPAAGRVAVVSVCVLFFTAQVALTFIPYNSISPPLVYGNTMGVVLMLANVAFLGGITWKLVAVVDWTWVKRAMPTSRRRCRAITASRV